MSVICITQARLGSSRFPKKVLMEISGVSLLEFHMQRVKQSQLVDKHIVAIPGSSKDQPLADFCHQKGYDVFQGSEENVLSRFYHAALSYGVKQDDTIIRLTGDCPLICPRLIDDVVAKHKQSNKDGYTHLSLGYWARGLDIEVFSMATLQSTFENASLAMELEHVTYYIYTHPKDFTIMPVEGGKAAWSDYRLCVDESDDFELLAALVAILGDDWPSASAEDICTLLDLNPQLTLINQSVIQKKSA
jgi:spore coat polysaccharide biosynthesis protein SpsF